MEYDRQTESMIHWQNVVREWLFLDGDFRFELLDEYPDLFTPILKASKSSVTYYADIVKVSEIWSGADLAELKDQLQSVSPALKRELKSLAIMVSSDDKAFSESRT